MNYGDLLITKKYTDKYTFFQNQSYEVADLMNNNEMFTDSDRLAIEDCGDYLSFGVTDDGELRL